MTTKGKMMSRTYRKPGTIVRHNKTNFIKAQHGHQWYAFDSQGWSQEDWDSESAERYDKSSRDGYYYETSRNRGFKNEAKGFLRRANRNFCKAVLQGFDVDNVALPGRCDGKKFYWNWW